MSSFEVDALISEYNRDYQNKWEQTRFISYVSAASAGAKLKSPKDLITFSWEDGYVVENTKLTEEEIIAIKNKMIESINNYEAGKVDTLKF